MFNRNLEYNSLRVAIVVWGELFSKLYSPSGKRAKPYYDNSGHKVLSLSLCFCDENLEKTSKTQDIVKPVCLLFLHQESNRMLSQDNTYKMMYMLLIIFNVGV